MSDMISSFRKVSYPIRPFELTRVRRDQVGRICDPKEIGEFIAFLGSVRVEPITR